MPFSTSHLAGAIIFTIIAVFSVLSYFGFRSRIPLASLLLQVVMDVSKHHTSVYVVAFTALFLQAGLAVWVSFFRGAMSLRPSRWYTFTVIATYVIALFPFFHFTSTFTLVTEDGLLAVCSIPSMRYAHSFLSACTAASNSSGCSSGKVAGLIFFETFSFLWTSQVIGNVALATLAGGPYGSWYYFGPRELGEMVRFLAERPNDSSIESLSAQTSDPFCVHASINFVVGLYRIRIA